MDDVHELPEGWEPPAWSRRGPAPWAALRWMRRRSLEAFTRDVRAPDVAQEAALQRVLDASRGTAFAQEHGLQRVRTLEDYREAVPVRSDGAYRPWLDRVVEGAPEALTRHAVTCFNRTSGTTGAAKLLPVTTPWAHAVAEAQAVWVAAMVAEQPDLARVGGRAFTTVGKAVEAHTPSGLPIGSNTGRMHAAQPWWIKLRYAVPASVFDIEDAQVRHYVLLRLALAVDVRSWTTANPSTILALCRAAVAHREALARDLVDGTLQSGPARALDPGLRRRLRPWVWRKRALPDDPRPGAFWPNLRAVNCWKGGAAPFFLERMADALGAEVPVREVGVSASEGHIAVPLHSSWWGGVVVTGGHLVEMVPLEGGTPVLPHQAEVGGDYRLVLSTTAGLYRYDLADVVRVEGRYARSPVVRFLRREGDVISVTGEKLTGEQLAEAARRALPPSVVGFVVASILDEVPRLALGVEGEVPAGGAEAFDRALCDLNGEYQSKRASFRHGGVEVRVLPRGAFARWRAERAADGVADGQVKEPVIVTLDALERLGR